MRAIALSALVLIPAAALAQAAAQPAAQPAAAPTGPELKGAFAPGFVPGGVFALPPAERFKAIDKNHDGRISKDEYQAVLNSDARPYIDSIFANRDTNKDGWLNETELNANTAARRAGGR